MRCQWSIVRTADEVNMVQCHHVLSSESGSGVCSAASTKTRQTEINSVARDRYALPTFFIYLTNETLSNLGCRPLADPSGGIDMELG
jgi:hypothetical protein